MTVSALVKRREHESLHGSGKQIVVIRMTRYSVLDQFAPRAESVFFENKRRRRERGAVFRSFIQVRIFFGFASGSCNAASAGRANAPSGKSAEPKARRQKVRLQFENAVECARDWRKKPLSCARTTPFLNRNSVRRTAPVPNSKFRSSC